MADLLPVDILFHVLGFVDLPTLVASRLVSRQFLCMSSRRSLWARRLRTLPDTTRMRDGCSVFLIFFVSEEIEAAKQALHDVTSVRPSDALPSFAAQYRRVKQLQSADDQGHARYEIANIWPGDHICAVSRTGGVHHAIVLNGNGCYDVASFALGNDPYRQGGLDAWLWDASAVYLVRSTEPFDMSACIKRVSLFREAQLPLASRGWSSASFAFFCSSHVYMRPDNGFCFPGAV